jgi:hypothetical protein
MTAVLLETSAMQMASSGYHHCQPHELKIYARL